MITIRSKDLAQQHVSDFQVIHDMIAEARYKASKQVNQTLIELYWNVGKYVSKKISSALWGQSVVDSLSEYIRSKEVSSKGFSARNIWRMKKFFDTYHGNQKLSAVLTEISWSNHLHIISKTKTDEEKEFYLQLASKNNYPERDFARIIDSGTFERTMLANKKLSTVLTEFPAPTKNVFKDTYLFEFAGVGDDHREHDLQKKLLANLRQFMLEMGSDFTFIDEEFLVQVGGSDFKIDLLMHHRGLNCLVAIELKVDDFKPEHLGKLQFYLEALDQDVRKPHENPSIGLLICKGKNDEVVKYAMNRNMSPALIAEYQTKFIGKDLLQKKLQELSDEIALANGDQKPPARGLT